MGTPGPGTVTVIAPASVLAQARTALAKRHYAEALRWAELLLRARVDDSVRAAALLIAADASYGMQAYPEAAVRYGEFVLAYAPSPEAPRAAMARGWSELRAGQRDRARQAWMQSAARFPADARAPLALALAAEIGRQTGDGTAENELIARHATTVYAAIARLNRSIAEVRAQREEAAARDLDAAIREHGVVAIEERRRVAEAIATHSEAPIDGPLPPQSPAGENADPIARAARVVDRRDGESGPYLLHSLVLLAATNHGWSDPLTLTVTERLADVFPSYPATPALLARIGTSAATAGQWQLARQAYEALAARYPDTPTARNATVRLGEALYRTGATGEAHRVLEKAAAAGGEEAPRALLLLADYHEMTGDRRAALAAYERVLRDYPRLERSPKSLLAHGRLLEQFGPGAQARSVLQKAFDLAQGEEAAEAAYRLGQVLRAEGQNAAAVEWYMTAAYTAGASSWGHRALLAAGTALSALGDRREALAIYLRLVANDAETGGEAAYRAAEIYSSSGRNEDALKMYMTSAQLTAGSPAESRALIGAARIAVATGDRAGAEALYQRLMQSRVAEPSLVIELRNVLRAKDGGPTSEPKTWVPVTDVPPQKP